MRHTHLRADRLRASLAVALTALLLAACSAASPTASEAASGRCAVTPDATSAATMVMSGGAFGDEITIAPGEAVTFTNEASVGHTVTEGTNGTAAEGACVDESIGAGASLVVTFTEPGDYQVTCRIHSSMETAIHVE